jgi:hypothetical protein
MTEVAGEGAILIDPMENAEAAKAIATRIGNADAVKQAGWENLKRFTADEAMTRYSDAYKSVIAQRR